MWRLLAGLGMILFSLATLSALVLVVMESVDRNFADAGRAALGAVVFTGAAFGCRRDWLRAQQAREFRRENAARTSKPEST